MYGKHAIQKSNRTTLKVISYKTKWMELTWPVPISMLIVYNILQLLALLVLGPILTLWVMASAKYRGRIPGRLGFGLTDLVRGLRPGARVWIHALSVGEMASARPLIESLRREMPGVVILLSATTRGGEEYGRRLAGLVDCQVPFPLDFYWVTARFVSLLRPDLFLLVETDFWPNLLSQLAKQGVPSLLVNGRITSESMAQYQRFWLLFAPLFNSFTKISMQMASDAERLAQLGVASKKIVICGNLKYDFSSPVVAAGGGLDLAKCGLIGVPLVVAGSTHDGEEILLFDLFAVLCKTYRDLVMVIAPRNVERASEVLALGTRRGLVCRLRSARDVIPCQILVLDTLGELAQVYHQADLAFVGGSLVVEGGHNPLEPAFFAKPVLFGPEMSDFAEISRDLLQAGGALMVTAETISEVMADLLADEEKRRRIGRLAGEFVLTNQGAAQRYLELIKEVIGHG